MVTFDSNEIVRRGWRQGSVLDQTLATKARAHAPDELVIDDSDWLIVTSHDCDVVSSSLDKEPFIEVLRAVVVKQRSPGKPQEGGRNPRALQLVINGSSTVVLACSAHDRWTMPRNLLLDADPASLLPDKQGRLVAEWLAKRYIRAAFPSAFDLRWRKQLKAWTSLLERQSRWIQGVYLRLSTLNELDTATPYRCQLIVAVPAKVKKEPGWANKRDEIEQKISAFWKQFTPGVELDEVEVLGTDEVTLADIEFYQRFDADWVSFADDSARTPPAVDMQA